MKHIDLKSLTMDELTGVVNLYPWFGSARKELFSKLLSLGGEVSDSAFAEASMYIPSRKSLGKLLTDRKKKVHQDKDAEKLLKAYIAPNNNDLVDTNEVNPPDKDRRKVYVVGGDYFSQDQYDEVKGSEEAAFPGFRIDPDNSKPLENVETDESVDIYTETLAQIYAEQGYYEQAKRIYSKLILAEPKKNAYFAALIQKLEQGN